jgi:hypothetical protein
MGGLLVRPNPGTLAVILRDRKQFERQIVDLVPCQKLENDMICSSLGSKTGGWPLC